MVEKPMISRDDGTKIQRMMEGLFSGYRTDSSVDVGIGNKTLESCAVRQEGRQI
jgi:hypothetical protein